MAETEIAVTELSEFRERRGEALAGSSTVSQAPVVPEGACPVPLPAGTVTLLLTDIEGSTRSWEAHGQAMAAAVARHYEILDSAIVGHGGVRPIEQGEGDSLVAAFARASDAVAAALEAQRALVEEDWPAGAALAVRMAVHTGEAQLRDERYYTGPSIIRCARLRALAHGGQVLISNTTAGGSYAEAARLFGAADALRHATGQTRWPLDQPAHDADVTQLRAALGDEPFTQLWKEGTALPLDEAASYASRARGERKRPRTGWAALTPAELEVVALAARGLTNAEIGRRLFISGGTARIHLSHVYAKLGVVNRARLAAEATARGIGEGSSAP
ncbi:MAG TPA: LuxR C-terminal-related transcriptional regulator [Acidimicrobiia bacterium]|jgi:class 3 adenylate cyclase/DNA-binding CsgD family transcriptional regulator